jgi:hypothetical protein
MSRNFEPRDPRFVHRLRVSRVQLLSLLVIGHAQSGIRFHIYALTSVNFDSVLDRIAGSRPLLRLEAQSRRESFAHERNPGKVAFANLTPIKVFQPKWHIFFVDC